MHMQIAAGLRRLGHDVHYLETTSNWPYDPVHRRRFATSDYAVAYLDRVADEFGLGDRWAYRRSFSDRAWLGPQPDVREDLLASADAVFNVAGSTRLAEDGLSAGQPRVLRDRSRLSTRSVRRTATKRRGPSSTSTTRRDLRREHRDAGEPRPAAARARGPHPPAGAARPLASNRWPTAPSYTTVANWKQDGREVQFRGERYLWSKDVEFHADHRRAVAASRRRSSWPRTSRRPSRCATARASR